MQVTTNHLLATIFAIHNKHEITCLLMFFLGQTPLELAEDDEEMEQFLERHAYDLMCVASNKKGWRFEGPWKSYGKINQSKTMQGRIR